MYIIERSRKQWWAERCGRWQLHCWNSEFHGCLELPRLSCLVLLLVLLPLALLLSTFSIEEGSPKVSLFSFLLPRNFFHFPSHSDSGFFFYWVFFCLFMLQKYRLNTLYIKHSKFYKNIKTCFIFQCRCDHISLGIFQEIKGTWWRILRIWSSFCFECGFGWFHVDFAIIILQFWMHFGPLVDSRKNVSKG